MSSPLPSTDQHIVPTYDPAASALDGTTASLEQKSDGSSSSSETAHRFQSVQRPVSNSSPHVDNVSLRSGPNPPAPPPFLNPGSEPDSRYTTENERPQILAADARSAGASESDSRHVWQRVKWRGTLSGPELGARDMAPRWSYQTGVSTRTVELDGLLVHTRANTP
ncbi:hypothetical protein PDE_06961 [Penicillium oxalicum 114-2]|uniref:Uncharacterized protein n=1 Tax=Penicillium oxalicum (strain 114-2 / CGMCC 5302) TaxID=933388 RepID=S8BAX9_PENO1|nr:hypothetical protein PDE_06961 [Penicillium oxalicum 114-2]